MRDQPDQRKFQTLITAASYLSQSLYIPGGHAFGEAEAHGKVGGDADLPGADVGVGRDG